MTRLTVQKIRNLNTLVIKQTEGRFFIATADSIIISVDSLANLLHFMVQNGLVSRKVLEVILQDTENEW
jgi:hypothetical protein